MTTFKGEVQRIAGILALPFRELYDSAMSAPHAKYLPDGSEHLPGGGRTSDRRLLHAITKTLEARRVLEVGVSYGSGALQMLDALPDDGEYVGVDRVTDALFDNDGLQVGAYIAVDIRVSLIYADVRDWIPNYDGPRFDVIHEDAAHSTPVTAATWQHARRLLNPGGIIMSHDATGAMSKGVLPGIHKAGFSPIIFKPRTVETCGYALWRAPHAN